MLKKTIIFRVDASSSIGLGHLTRCFLLAKELQAKGYPILFVTKKYEGISVQLIKRCNFSYFLINDRLTGKNEAEKIISEAKKNDAGAIIFDSYNLSNSLIAEIKESGLPLFLIDDRNYLKKPNVDAIINGNEFASSLHYDVFKKTELFLGRKFFLLGKKFRSSSRDISKKRKYTLGLCLSSAGYDKFKSFFDFLSSFSGRKIAVIFTATQKKEMQRIKKIFRNARNIKIYYNLTSLRLARIMKDCYFFFCSGGTTMYQATACGCLTYASAVNKYQQININSLSKYKLVTSLQASRETLLKTQKQMEYIIKNPALRMEASRRAVKFMDGRGLERVTKIINRKITKYKCQKELK